MNDAGALVRDFRRLEPGIRIACSNGDVIPAAPKAPRKRMVLAIDASPPSQFRRALP